MGILDEFDTTDNISSVNTGNVRPSRKRNLFGLFGVIILLTVAIGGSIFVIKSRPEILGLSKSSSQAQKEVEDTVSKVGKIIELPEGETPTLATVTDLNKVSDQAFFKKAKMGDIVLVYKGAGKAYIYRPSENKIVEVGVVNANGGSGQEGAVAGESSEIPVITPTPLPTAIPVISATATPRPTNIPTNVPTQSFVSPTAAP